MFDLVNESQRYATKVSIAQVDEQSHERMVKAIVHAADNPLMLLEAINGQIKSDIINQLNDILSASAIITLESDWSHDDSGGTYSQIHSFQLSLGDHCISIPMYDEEGQLIYIEEVKDPESEHDIDRKVFETLGIALEYETISRLMGLVESYWEVEEPQLETIEFPVQGQQH